MAITRRSSTAILSALAVLIGTVALAIGPVSAQADGECTETGFPDVPAYTFYTCAVEWMTENGFAYGYDDGTFRPDDSANRGEFATFFWRYLGSNHPTNPPTFPDVEPDAFYADAVATMAEDGLLYGFPDGTFRPNENVTRVQQLTFLWRSAGSPTPGTDVDFPDTEPGTWYADALSWAAENGLAYGYPDGTFRPHEDVSRGELATFLHRYDQWDPDDAPANIAPSLAPIDDRIGEAAEPIEITVTASDPDDGPKPLSFTATGMPDGLSIDTDTGTMTGRVVREGTSNITVTVTDGDDHTSRTFDLSVRDTSPPPPTTPPGNAAPVLESISDSVVLEGKAIDPITVTATDPDGDDFTLEVTGLPGGLAFANDGDGTGRIIGTPGDAMSGDHTVTVTAADGADTGTEHFVITVAPTTGLEERDGDGWTTHQEELTFLAEVANGSSRVSYSEIGRTHEDRPLHLVQVGNPAPPTNQAIKDGMSVLVIGSQHGNEQAGREMALQLIRDFAFTADPELVEQLNDTTILVIPSANPDGTVADQRRNAVGVDLNRDHFHLTQPESRAVAGVLRDFRPDISVDAHEASSSPSDPEIGYMKIAWQRNLNVHQEIYQLNVEMVDDYLFPGLEAAGYTEYGHYGSPNDGEDGPWFLSQNFGMRHGLGILTESWVGGEPTTRVDIQMQTILEILRFQRDHGDEVAEVTTRARMEKAEQGQQQSAPFYLRGADWDTEPPPDEYVLDPPPCGYLLHAEHASMIDTQVGLFPLVTEEVGEDGLFLTMGQPLMTMIPDLVDERGRQNLVDGIPLDDCADPGSVTPPPPPPPPTEPAQYSYDFSEDVVGEAPAGWTETWNDSEYVVLDNPRRLQHQVQSRSAGAGRQALIIDEIGDAGVVRGDVEVSALVKGIDDDTLFQLGLHISEELPQNANAYYVDARRSTASVANHLRIGRHIGGSFSILSRSEAPFTVMEDTWYRVVLRREDGYLRAKLWEDGENEPDEWMTTVWNGSFDDGKVGIMHFSGGTVVDWAFIGVGVGGEEAPRPPEGLVDQ